jgi:hypothetical protein
MFDFFNATNVFFGTIASLLLIGAASFSIWKWGWPRIYPQWKARMCGEQPAKPTIQELREAREREMTDLCALYDESGFKRSTVHCSAPPTWGPRQHDPILVPADTRIECGWTIAVNEFSPRLVERVTDVRPSDIERKVIREFLPDEPVKAIRYR